MKINKFHFFIFFLFFLQNMVIVEDLQPIELDYINRNLKKLNTVWGYSNNHTDYERKSHDCSWIQTFTDPLFRLIFKTQSKGWITASDHFFKVAEARHMRLGSIDESLVDKASRLVNRYFSEPDISRIIISFVDDISQWEEPSMAFTCMGASAKFLLLFRDEETRLRAFEVMEECYSVIR